MSTPACLERRRDLTDRLGRLLAERVGAFDQRHESRARDRDDLDARVVRVDELLVAPAPHRPLGREEADAPVSRRERGGVGLGLEDADDGNGERALEVGERRRGRGVAGDDDELHVLRLEVPADREREAPAPRRAGAGRTGAVRCRRGRRASSCGSVTSSSWRTVRPPTPESNTPIGRPSIARMIRARPGRAGLTMLGYPSPP